MSAFVCAVPLLFRLSVVSMLRPSFSFFSDCITNRWWERSLAVWRNSLTWHNSDISYTYHIHYRILCNDNLTFTPFEREGRIKTKVTLSIECLIRYTPISFFMFGLVVYNYSHRVSALEHIHNVEDFFTWIICRAVLFEVLLFESRASPGYARNSWVINSCWRKVRQVFRSPIRYENTKIATEDCEDEESNLRRKINAQTFKKKDPIRLHRNMLYR